MKLPEVILFPLQLEDREQFILDNQWAFKYGAQQEFGMRDERCEEGEEVISRKTIEDSIDGENAETYRIVLDGQKVGGVVLQNGNVWGFVGYVLASVVVGIAFVAIGYLLTK